MQVHLQSPRVKHENLLLLQNRFEALEQISDNVSDFTSPDARKTGAKTVQTKVAPINGKTQVQKVPKKSPDQSNVIELCQGSGGGVCNDIKTSNSHLTYQSHDKSQARLNNDSTVPTDIVLTNLKEIDNIPVECDTSDLDTSVQTQYATVGNLSREEVVPIDIWADKNSSKDY